MSTETAETRLKSWTFQEIQESAKLMGVTVTMPEGHASSDCGAAGHHRVWRNTSPCCCGQNSTFKFGGDGDPVEVSFAVTLTVQIGDSKTRIEAFVVPGSTPHLISRKWLSQHRCLVNFDPNHLRLESPEFGSVPLVLHSSGHLLLSLDCHGRFSELFLKHSY